MAQKDSRIKKYPMLSIIAASGSATAAKALQNDLTPYTGPWGYEQAAHLLRRSMFGPNYAQIKWSATQGLSATLERLFEERALPDPPLNASLKGDRDLPFGEPWIDAPLRSPGVSKRLEACSQSLKAWNTGVILNEGISLREKLTLFWHNHFPIERINDPRFKYRYVTLLRTHAWGDFRQLTKDITIDPSMLKFLNGDQNTKKSPNENYARELLELFTIGKGASAGPGDYTTFTEQDVQEISRVLTGWSSEGYRGDSQDGKVRVIFKEWEHDEGVKQLSHRLGSATIENTGDREYAYLIDLLFRQDEVARFICRKLYRWFVYHHIDEEIEAGVIEPMARILIEANFQIKPALEALLASGHFFRSLYSGAIIKNPIDYVMSVAKPLSITIPQDLEQKYVAWETLDFLAANMEMRYFEVPQVAGWRAYYLAPIYYRDWITSPTLRFRMYFIDRIASHAGFNPLRGNGPRLRIQPLSLLATIDQPADPNAVVREFARILFPKPLTAEARDRLKEILIPGLPDFEWTVEYNTYLSNPSDANLADAISRKLLSLLRHMLSMAEFHLS
jgi:uncharacterized protein (DUF1800 family)